MVTPEYSTLSDLGTYPVVVNLHFSFTIVFRCWNLFQFALTAINYCTFPLLLNGCSHLVLIEIYLSFKINFPICLMKSISVMEAHPLLVILRYALKAIDVSLQKYQGSKKYCHLANILNLA